MNIWWEKIYQDKWKTMLPIITDTFDQLGNLAMDANVYEMMQIHGFGVLSSVDDV